MKRTGFQVSQVTKKISLTLMKFGKMAIFKITLMKENKKMLFYEVLFQKFDSTKRRKL